MLLGPNGTKSSHMVHFHFGAHCLLSNAHPSKTPSSHSLFSVFPINHMLSQSQQGGSHLSSSIVTSTTNTRQPQNQLQAPGALPRPMLRRNPTREIQKRQARPCLPPPCPPPRQRQHKEHVSRGAQR